MIDRVLDLLLHPVEYFRSVASEEVGSVLKTYLVLLCGYALLVAVLAATGLSVTVPPRLSVPAGFPVIYPSAVSLPGWLLFIIGGSLVSTLVYALIIELVIWTVFGLECTKGIGQTLKARLIGQTPFLLFSWIPFLWIPAVLYDLILFVIGLRELHGISTGKAIVAAFLVPVLCLTPLVVLVLMRVNE